MANRLAPYSIWGAYEAHICFKRAMGKPYLTFDSYIARIHYY